MGTWDVHTFDNDSACDWADNFAMSDDLGPVESAFACVLEAGHSPLDADLACRALAACEVVARLKGHWGPRTDLSEPLDQWVEDHPMRTPAALVKTATAVIDRVLTPPSELLEGWVETHNLDDWRASVNDLRARVIAKAVPARARKAAVKKRVRRAQPEVGAVIEILTPRGLAYAHYTHRSEMMGDLIRVFEGFWTERPAQFSEVVRGQIQFMTFVLLRNDCSDGPLRVVAHEPVPKAAARFPVFRCTLSDREGRTYCRWLWDGQHEWRIHVLKPEYRLYPDREMWNSTLLIERIVEGWRPEMVELHI